MKKLSFTLMALLFVMPTFAQSDDGEEIGNVVKAKNNAFFLGPKAGVTMTTMTQPDEGKLFDKSDIGFSAGLALKTRFGKATPNSEGGTGFLGLGLEFKYMQNKAKTIATDENGNQNASLSVSYFEAPVYVQFYPMAKSNAMNNLYIEVGAAFVGTLSRSPKTLTVYEPSADYSQVTYKLDADGSKLKGMDVRPMAGIGYTIPGTGLDINARYYLGMSKMAENFKSKMNTLEVSLSWMFNIAKF